MDNFTEVLLSALKVGVKTGLAICLAEMGIQNFFFLHCSTLRADQKKMLSHLLQSFKNKVVTLVVWQTLYLNYHFYMKTKQLS